MKKLLVTCSLVAAGSMLSAQDYHLTQYDAAKIYLNPAMTGMFDGYYRIHANYRNQWTAVAANPFQTAAIAFDMPVKRYGWGAQVMNSRAGIGNFNELGITISGAYDLQCDKANIHHVSFGMAVAGVQKSVDMARLTWGNQYSMSINGFDTGVPSGENSANMERDYNMIINAGALYYYAKENSRINPFIGVSASNLNRPNESFFGYTSKLPIHYIVHTGARVGITERLVLNPRFLYMRQTNAQEMAYGILANIYLPDQDAYIIAGPTFRNKDAAIFEVGLKMGQFTYRLSYDVNVSTLKPATNNRGGIEFSLIYVAKRRVPVVAPNCPRL
ncbi:MAG: PorP/SprF family type IX secretion system membrane protein [Bacteroidia bacterium]|nr:PorP/SprF family type IX secretion system membrane protein [Bacteroidia bacterium]